MEKIYLILFTVFFIASAFSQQKPPVVENDYVNILAGDTIEVNVLLNDYCMEGHTMEIFFAAQGTGGVTTNTDSTITFSSYFYFEGIDSVKYIVQDLDNGLLSENGYLIVTIDNSGNGYLDINNVSALINAYGFQFCSHPDYDQWFEVPKGSGKNSIFCYTLWMGGLDENNELHLAAERYRQVGEDYWVGPVSAIYENQQIINWNKIRKLSRDEIKYHQSHWWESGYTPIDNIKNWPAHGNEMLGQADKLAPFIDWNDNGIYGTEKGDYPAVRG
ncbi:MAG: Ig-like domain-containing protein, partial [Bacteroidetes bacterium]|nr:Ig-like domain-containing protein [Bacteroidota bacterium]